MNQDSQNNSPTSTESTNNQERKSLGNLILKGYMPLILFAIVAIIFTYFARYIFVIEVVLYDLVFPIIAFGIAFNLFGFGKRTTVDGETKALLQKLEKQPNNIQYSWDLAQTKMANYLDTNIDQVKSIYATSIIVMLLGFVLILASLGFGIGINIFIKPESNGEDGVVNTLVSDNMQLVVTLVGTSAGIILEFIGATFLFLYRSTIQQAIHYVNKLERMNNVGMAMQILGTMNHDEVDSILAAKIEIAKQLLLVAQKETDLTATSNPNSTTSAG